MIRLYEAHETKFDHNKQVLDVYSAIVSEQGNGDFSLELTCPLTYADTIKPGMIITAPTPRFEQPFRVFSVQKTLKQLRVKARHITYDTASNFIEDARPTGVAGQAALSHIEGKRVNPSNVNLTSDITLTGTAYYVRKTELEALIGAENSFLNVWGGYLIRDEWNMHFRNDLQDRGYVVELGQNLTGVEAMEDMTNVVTKILPTFVLEDNEVYYLPEKYILSPLADKYPEEITRELRIKLTEAQRQQSAESLYPYIREQVTKAFDEGLDKPVLSYKVNFVELSKTEAYKDLELLEKLDIFDVVTCKVPTLDIDVKLVMVSYTYDAIKDMFTSMTLGEQRPTSASSSKQLQRSIEQQIIRDDSPVMIKINNARQKIVENITGVNGGSIVTRLNADGVPYEILLLDGGDINTARYVVRLNNKGIALSSTGVNGPYGVAIDARNGIYANQLYALIVTAGMIATGAIRSNHIMGNQINGSHIQSRTITADNIAYGTLTGDQIKANSIGVDKLQAFTISANQIKTGRLQANSGGSYIDLDNGTAYFTGTVNASNISNSSMTGSGYGGSYSFSSTGSSTTTSQTAKTFAFESGTIASGVKIGNYMYASGTGLFVNGAGYVCSFETMGNAWVAIHHGANNDRFNAANLIWGVTTSGVVATSDMKTKKNIEKIDYNLALDFIKEINLWEFDRIQDDRHSIGIIANFLKYSEHPYADFVLGKYVSPQGDSVLTANYDNLAIINVGAVKALDEKVTTLEAKVTDLEEENNDLKSRLERLEKLVLESEVTDGN